MWLYVITNITNGKSYVGQTTQGHRRWHEHVRIASRGGTPLARAMRKYGIAAFTMVLDRLPNNANQNMLDAAEVALIVALNTTVPYGYNLRLGGNGGIHHESTKAKTSTALRGH